MAEVTNYIDRLVAELCPDGVEYRPLSDVVEKNYGGGTPSKAKEEYWGGDIPWASVGDLSNDLMEIFDTRSKITPAGVSGSSTNVVPAGAVIVAIKIAPGKMKIAGVDLAINQDIRGLVLNDLMNARFLTYYFRTLMFAGHGTIVKSITNKRLMDTEVPVPPLEIQEAIVEILDKFTNLEAELEAELEARRAQYEYYRNQLLSYDALVSRCPNGVQYKSIGSFSKCVAGATPNSKNPSLWDGDIPWMSSGEVNKKTVYSTNRFITQLGFDSCSTKMVPAGAVVIALAGQGKTRGTVARIRIELCTNQSLCAIITDKTVDSDYLFHYLSGQYDNLRAVSSGDGTRGGLNLKMIRAYKVPVPPIEEQRRIADVLDRFDTLVNDISSGLPAEIAARRAQYEYYRDRLLSFPEKK